MQKNKISKLQITNQESKVNNPKKIAKPQKTKSAINNLNQPKKRKYKMQQ